MLQRLDQCPAGLRTRSGAVSTRGARRRHEPPTGGTARGGILVAIAEKFKLPVHYIGVGETRDDLEPFAARDFARAIAGLEDEA